jgi:phosphate transport system protein
LDRRKRVLEERIIALRKEIIEYATLAENMIDKSISGLLKKDNALLAEIIGKDEPRANDIEIFLDELCTTMIAQYQPKARDLRAILMALKMNNDLERVADHAVNISESGLFLIESRPVKPLIDIPRMAEISIKMLKDSITSYINEDAALAHNVCERDSIVDGLGDKILRELITIMGADPTTIERSLHLLIIARNLERIADLSTNICEDVIFMVEGKIIKHHNV